MITDLQSPSTKARDARLPPPIGGFVSSAPMMVMKPTTAVTMENFYPFPDRIQMRDGFTEHVTGFAEIPHRLWVYSKGDGTQKLFATADDGVFDVTSAGALGAAVATITEGRTSAANISTGAAHYLVVVNGVDDLQRYDGSTWTSVATLGSTATNTLNRVEVYRQRLFFAEADSLNLHYLPVNSISGTAVSYPLGAIFRRGGYIIALGTWTLDGGIGPEDQLAVATSEGEVAVFSGNDPSNPASWGLRGVYFIGKPLGEQPLFKYGGDLLFLSENGLYPLSKAVQSTALDRVPSVTENIRQFFNDAARDFRANEGWQVFAIPDIPLLLVNIPAEPLRKQVVMHAQTGVWSTLTGWNAYSFARVGSDVYFSTSTTVEKLGEASDNGASITATLIQAYTEMGYPGAKQVVLIKPFFVSQGAFEYTIGVTNDFKALAQSTDINHSELSGAALWGSAIWGTAVWGGADTPIQEWLTIPDDFSVYKALYLQIASNSASVQYIGSRAKFLPGGDSLD